MTLRKPGLRAELAQACSHLPARWPVIPQPRTLLAYSTKVLEIIGNVA
jgi:hypothetical protein